MWCMLSKSRIQVRFGNLNFWPPVLVVDFPTYFSPSSPCLHFFTLKYGIKLSRWRDRACTSTGIYLSEAFCGNFFNQKYEQMSFILFQITSNLSEIYHIAFFPNGLQLILFLFSDEHENLQYSLTGPDSSLFHVTNNGEIISKLPLSKMPFYSVGVFVYDKGQRNTRSKFSAFSFSRFYVSAQASRSTWKRANTFRRICPLQAMRKRQKESRGKSQNSSPSPRNKVIFERKIFYELTDWKHFYGKNSS